MASLLFSMSDVLIPLACLFSLESRQELLECGACFLGCLTLVHGMRKEGIEVHYLILDLRIAWLFHLSTA